MAVIGTNIAAVSATNYLNYNNTQLTKSIQKLASGSRLADPSDDAAGVAVSGNLSARIRRLTAASQGAQDVVSAAQTTDGFLTSIQNILTRLSELAQEATNGSFGSADRANYQTEFSTLKTQIDSIASNATFDGISLFAATSITVAINADGVTDYLTLSTVGSTTSLGISTVSISTTTAALSSLTLLNSAISCITTRRASVNADVSKFNFYITNINTERTNVTSANSAIADLDIASESTNLSKYNILLQSATAELAQANSSQQAVLSLLK
ncbi:flagellin [Verrucomicrobium sp. GAS474]|uniref:flagellin n=1 Tax=Verrucomicrobium sp. GAS474 TaxID=1882831 RepID=UPI00087AE87E|nr:flagellin [Verrucomicrobium sp. GAS474]SDU00021.1 flagellin [Verrucomicrobium sp. GAS474]